MTYARTASPAGPLDPIEVRSPSRRGETKLLDGTVLVPPVDGWTDDIAAACGFERIVTTVRPADTPTTTHDLTVVLVDGPALVPGMTQVPTQTWTERAKTQAELDADTVENRGGQIADRIAAEIQWIADNIEAAPDLPTGASLTLNNNAQVIAAVRDLQDEVRLHRFAIKRLGRDVRWLGTLERRQLLTDDVLYGDLDPAG